MIRLALPADEAALMAVADSIDLFGPEELADLKSMLTDYFNGNQPSEEFWLVNENDAGTFGAAYCAPERMTNGTWNLLFIGIRPESQGKGYGSTMMTHIEQMLIEKGAHLLLVETLAEFDRTRAFYNRCGYEKEAQIRDFYDVGADKVIYRKALSTQDQHTGIDAASFR